MTPDGWSRRSLLLGASAIALVDSTISATPIDQSSGNGEYSAGSIRLAKPRKTGMEL